MRATLPARPGQGLRAPVQARPVRTGGGMMEAAGIVPAPAAAMDRALAPAVPASGGAVMAVATDARFSGDLREAEKGTGDHRSGTRGVETPAAARTRWRAWP